LLSSRQIPKKGDSEKGAMAPSVSNGTGGGPVFIMPTTMLIRIIRETVRHVNLRIRMMNRAILSPFRRENEIPTATNLKMANPSFTDDWDRA
jgi:hypothetical protein